MAIGNNRNDSDCIQAALEALCCAFTVNSKQSFAVINVSKVHVLF